MRYLPPALDPNVVAEEGTLVAIQRKVLDCIRAITALSRVTDIWCEDDKTLDEQLRQALVEAKPLSIMVSLGPMRDTASGVPGRLELDALEVIITLYENPLFNRTPRGTNLTINRALEIVATRLKCQPIAASFLNSPRVETPGRAIGDTLAKSIIFKLAATVLADETGDAP